MTGGDGLVSLVSGKRTGCQQANLFNQPLASKMQRATEWAPYRDKRRKIPQGLVACNPVSCMQALLDRWVVADHHTHRCDSRKNLCPLDTRTDLGGHVDSHSDGDQVVGVPIRRHACSIGVISALKAAESERHCFGRDGTALHPPLYLLVCNRDQPCTVEMSWSKRHSLSKRKLSPTADASRPIVSLEYAPAWETQHGPF